MNSGTERARKQRADRIRGFLQEVWGDGPPTGPDPLGTVLVDAVTVDDHFGVQDGVVVQGDGLGYDLLADLLRRAGVTAPHEVLPPALVSRMTAQLALPASAVPRQVDLRNLSGTPAEATMRCTRVLEPRLGAWELDIGRRTVTWDPDYARLVSAGDQGGSAPWDDHLGLVVHPDDQPALRDAVVASSTGRARFDVSFRSRDPEGTWRWRRAGARRLDPPDDAGPRLIGIVTPV